MRRGSESPEAIQSAQRLVFARSERGLAWQWDLKLFPRRESVPLQTRERARSGVVLPASKAKMMVQGQTQVED